MPGPMTRDSGSHYGSTPLLKPSHGCGVSLSWVTSMISSMLGSKVLDQPLTLSTSNLLYFLVSSLALVESQAMSSLTKRRCTTSSLATGATLSSCTHTSCSSTSLATTKMLLLLLIQQLALTVILFSGSTPSLFQDLWCASGNRTPRESRKSMVRMFHSCLSCGRILSHGAWSSMHPFWLLSISF